MSGPLFRPTRRGVLQGGLAAGLWALLPSRPAWAATDRRFIVYWAGGGWDPTFVFDPHFDSDIIEGDPSAELGSAGGLAFADAPSRPTVRSFFETWGGQTCIINGVAVGSISHLRCSQIMLTGSREPDAPDLPTILGALLGESRALPTALLSGPRYPGTLGANNVAVNSVLTGTATGILPGPSSFDAEREARIRRYLSEEGTARLERSPTMSDWIQGLERFDALEASASAIELSERSGFDEQLVAAVAALQLDLAQVVVLGGDLPAMSSWDTHRDNDFLQDQNFERMFQHLSSLMGLLETTTGSDGSPLSSKTTVLVMSEMGRTPVQNASGGKDHWPYTSLMVAGAGVRGGSVVGVSDDALVASAIDHSTGEAHESGEVLTSATFAAGVMQSLGLDVDAYFAGVTPFTAPWTS